MIGWDIAFRKSSRSRYGDDRDLSEDYLECVIVEEEDEYLDELEEKFKPIIKELIRVSKDIDLDIKETKRRVKMLAMNADKIKGGVENEIGMRNITTTLTKTKLDTLKERVSFIKILEDLRIKRATASGVGLGLETGNLNAGHVAKITAMNHKNRLNRGTVDRGLFDIEGGEPCRPSRFDDSTAIDGVGPEDNIVVRSTEAVSPQPNRTVDTQPNNDADRDIEFKSVGKVDYGYGARNMLINRQCTKDDNRIKTRNVMYYDTDKKKYWVGLEDMDGNKIQGQERSLRYFINANMDFKAMRAEDPSGTVYDIVLADVSEMPMRYAEEWAEID